LPEKPKNSKIIYTLSYCTLKLLKQKGSLIASLSLFITTSNPDEAAGASEPEPKV
jgi:hypothetical protein